MLAQLQFLWFRVNHPKCVKLLDPFALAAAYKLLFLQEIVIIGAHRLALGRVFPS